MHWSATCDDQSDVVQYIQMMHCSVMINKKEHVMLIAQSHVVHLATDWSDLKKWTWVAPSGVGLDKIIL